MVSLKMFQINHSKALIIAYLDLRGGLKKYTFNWRDISNQTNIGRTVVNHYLNELVAEGVLNRKGKSFYKLNRQKMEELYYAKDGSDSDFNRSESNINGSENDPNRSESDPIHSSNLNSRILESSSLDSRKLDTSGSKEPELPAIVKELLSRSPKEQVEWLDRIEANKTMQDDLRTGKDVPMTAQFEEEFANW